IESRLDRRLARDIHRDRYRATTGCADVLCQGFQLFDLPRAERDGGTPLREHPGKLTAQALRGACHQNHLARKVEQIAHRSSRSSNLTPLYQAQAALTGLTRSKCHFATPKSLATVRPPLDRLIKSRLTTIGSEAMDLGIRGKKAIVCASS